MTITVKQFAFDGYMAVIEDAPLVRSLGATEEEAATNVLVELQRIETEGE